MHKAIAGALSRFDQKIVAMSEAHNVLLNAFTALGPCYELSFNSLVTGVSSSMWTALQNIQADCGNFILRL